jgi:hypothetical protein
VCVSVPGRWSAPWLATSASAARFFIAQQALSRDIARFERELGVRLFDRSTRSVSLTAEGERLLPQARQLLDLVDQLPNRVRGEQRRLRVDVIRHGSTAAQVVDRAARDSTGEERFETRFHGGFTAAYHALLGHRVDVIFGRPGGARTGPSQGFARRLVRLEPLGLLVDQDHELAARPAIQPTAFKGLTIDTSAGNVDALEWVDLATELVESFQGTPSPEHHPGDDVGKRRLYRHAVHERPDRQRTPPSPNLQCHSLAPGGPSGATSVPVPFPMSSGGRGSRTR